MRYLCLYTAKGSFSYEVFKYVIKYLKELRCNIGTLWLEGLGLYIRKRNPGGPTVCYLHSNSRYKKSNVLSDQVPVNQSRTDIFSCEQSLKLDWNEAASRSETTRPAHAPAVRGIAQQIWKRKTNFFQAQNHKHCFIGRVFLICSIVKPFETLEPDQEKKTKWSFREKEETWRRAIDEGFLPLGLTCAIDATYTYREPQH